MSAAERIHEAVLRLSPRLQAEVLDYVEFLLARSSREGSRIQEEDWSIVSLASALRGMEDEDTPTYSREDLVAVFR